MRPWCDRRPHRAAAERTHTRSERTEWRPRAPAREARVADPGWPKGRHHPEGVWLTYRRRVSVAWPLSGVQVVDLSSGLAGAYCAKLLADGGADVVKVEDAIGDPLRRVVECDAPLAADDDGALFRFLCASSDSVVGDAALARALVARAQIVVWSAGSAIAGDPRVRAACAARRVLRPGGRRAQSVRARRVRGTTGRRPTSPVRRCVVGTCSAARRRGHRSCAAVHRGSGPRGRTARSARSRRGVASLPAGPAISSTSPRSTRSCTASRCTRSPGSRSPASRSGRGVRRSCRACTRPPTAGCRCRRPPVSSGSTSA